MTMEDSKLSAGEFEKMNVLVAEDDKDISRILKFNLETSGFSVRTAENGKIALDLVRESKPDAVILDVMMPVMDGFEVCKRLKSMNSTRDIPIIFLTARGSTEDKIKGMGFDPDDYMIKPFEFKELLARLNLHISKSQVKKSDIEAEHRRVSREVINDLTVSFFEPMNQLREELVKMMERSGGDAGMEEAIRRCECYRRELRRIYIDFQQEVDPLFEPEPEEETVEVMSECGS